MSKCVINWNKTGKESHALDVFRTVYHGLCKVFRSPPKNNCCKITRQFVRYAWCSLKIVCVEQGCKKIKSLSNNQELTNEVTGDRQDVQLIERNFILPEGICYYAGIDLMKKDVFTSVYFILAKMEWDTYTLQYELEHP